MSSTNKYESVNKKSYIWSQELGFYHESQLIINSYKTANDNKCLTYALIQFMERSYTERGGNKPHLHFYISLIFSEVYASETTFLLDISVKTNEQKSKIGKGVSRICD